MYTAARALVAVLLCASIVQGEERLDRHFTNKVWPLLEARCVTCHGAEEQEGGLRLDTRTAAIKGGRQGPAISTDKPSSPAAAALGGRQVQRLG